MVTEATIKVHVNGERIIETAEGNGPVNALDKALRQAIERKFPQLHDIHLINYSVRILDEDKGTAAKTRVLIDSSDGRDTWGSVGVSDQRGGGLLAGAGGFHRTACCGPGEGAKETR